MVHASLRILHLASHDSLARGGAVQMLRLARGLAERGHTVTAAFNTQTENLSGDPHFQRARAAGVNIIGIPLSDPDSATSAIQKLWRAGQYDILHVHREQALFAAATALKNEHVPAFVAQRGTIYMPPLLGREHRLLLSRRVHRIVAVAHAVKAALVRRRFVPPHKIEVVYGGVETEIFHPGIDGAALRAQHNISPAARVITLPGALIEKKGPQDFLRAATLVHAQHPDTRFWLVGHGKLEPDLRRLAAELPLADHIQFLGHVQNMPEVYAASDLVVCASIKGEGLTGTLREALAMARPVVTTDCAGNTELVEENKTGFVCKMANPHSLAAAILRALADPARATELAQAGHARVLAWCSEPIRSETIEQIYLNILTKTC